MMTKCFTRVRHKLLAGRVLELQVGDAFVDFHGNPIKHVELEPRSDKLYQEMPPGLKIDMLLPDRRGSAEAVQLVRVLEACAEMASEGGKTAELAKEISQGALAMLIEMVIGHLSAHVQRRIHAAVASRAQNCKHRAALGRAIIDSGASGTFVPPEIILTNVKPGRGSVSVANGNREPILEQGDLGPLLGAQKVRSFHRVLVSVTQLCKQFGPVIFTTEGVQLVSQAAPGEECIITTIGLPTRNNLFSFDLTALQQHARAVAQAERRK